MRNTDSNDTTKSYFRTQDRLFSTNGQWFFTTREGEIGPFKTRETAVKEVRRYVQERRDLDRFQKARSGEMRARAPNLAIVPKEEELDLTLDDLILENQR
jgi:hypothetical protein